jgi:predicted phosphodiesterase
MAAFGTPCFHNPFTVDAMKWGVRNETPLTRIAVIGDVHAEHERLQRTLDWLQGEAVDAVVCTGDIADGPGCLMRASAALRDAKVITVAGNHDRWLLQDRVRHVQHAHRLEETCSRTVEYLSTLPGTRELETVAGRVLLCHGIGSNDLGKAWPGTERSKPIACAELDSIISTGRYRFIINGHMHFRVIVNFRTLTLINAGTITGPHPGVLVVDFAAATVASYNVCGSRPVHVCTLPMRGDDRTYWRDTQAFDGAWQPVVMHAGA